MTDHEAISLLRYALACIWTEIEGDHANLENCQKIANEALDLTIDFAQCKNLSILTGLEAWRDKFGHQ